jgi:hypothetical protein
VKTFNPLNPIASTILKWLRFKVVRWISFHGSFVKGVLNIIDTNMAAEKYTSLYRSTNLFIFRIYSMG